MTQGATAVSHAEQFSVNFGDQKLACKVLIHSHFISNSSKIRVVICVALTVINPLALSAEVRKAMKKTGGCTLKKVPGEGPGLKSCRGNP